MKIGFIGYGNMAKAIIKSLEKYEIKFSDGEANQAVVDFADIIFLTIKPQEYENVLSQLSFSKGKIIVTVAPGITFEKLKNWVQGSSLLVRTMPNTPAIIGCGVTAICKSENITDADFVKVKTIMGAFSSVYELNEVQMDTAVAISGSSPVLGYILVEAMSKFAQENGINFETAKQMAAQTLIGACKMILQSGESTEVLTQRVCSKGGTTEKLIESLAQNNFAETIANSMSSCLKQARKLAQ